jgi:2-dehydropantoate 2-reductase
MRFVVLGAGAIGGSVGALLARAGCDVAFIARGDHGDAIRERGLVLDTPDESFVVHAPVMRQPVWRGDDVVFLAVKAQDAELAIRDIPPEVPIVCLTNGIAAERLVARRVRRVFGAYVFVPASHLVPGSVQLWASPVAGAIDVGAYPHGSDELANAISTTLRRAGFMSELRQDIMRHKRGKLLGNLGNVIEALCGPFDGELEIETRARDEGVACFAAAGLDYVIGETRTVDVRPIRGTTRPGCSTWQSLRRGKSLEVDFLNGEIVAIGRARGVPTPINARLQRLAAEVIERKAAPGSMSIEAINAAVLR